MPVSVPLPCLPGIVFSFVITMVSMAGFLVKIVLCIVIMLHFCRIRHLVFRIPVSGAVVGIPRFPIMESRPYVGYNTIVPVQTVSEMVFPQLIFVAILRSWQFSMTVLQQDFVSICRIKFLRFILVYVLKIRGIISLNYLIPRIVILTKSVHTISF